jgi:L-rhamnose isomerase
MEEWEKKIDSVMNVFNPSFGVKTDAEKRDAVESIIVRIHAESYTQGAREYRESHPAEILLKAGI